MPRRKEKLTPIPEPARTTKPQSRERRAASATGSVPPDLSHIAESLRGLAVPLSEIAFLTGNPLRHPEPQIEQLRASLKQFGQVEALVVNRRTSPAVVIGGNGRLAAMLAENWTHAAVCFVDLDTARANALAIALNRTREGASWDDAALAEMMKQLDTGNDPQLDAMFSKLAEDLHLIGQDEPSDQEPTEEESEADEDGLDLLFKAPFPWFGGKARIAKIVWRRFGDVRGYIEPFFGSGAVLLNRPQPFDGVETINDLDALVCNAWRAIQADPDAVAKYADWPVIASDLAARHSWLVSQKESLQAKCEGDMDYFDAKIAGYWLWGMSLWIGRGFCSGNGPWQVVEAEDGSRQLVHLSNAGRGVHRKRVHLSDAGRGVNRKRVEEAGEGKAGLGERGLLEWMRALAERLRRVRVCCDDWTSVCGGKSGNALQHFFAAGEPCGVFLDPPYSAKADRDSTIYRKEDLQVAHAVREWAIAHGDDKRLRIALAGYEGEHEMPASWECVKWKAHGGMGVLAKGEEPGKGQRNRFRERVWFSPACLKP